MNTQVAFPHKKDNYQKVGSWILESQITDGSATKVFRVKCSRTQREGALKLFKSHSEGFSLAQNEIRALQIEHPNLPVLLDSGITPEGLSFLVTEYVQGPNLEEILKQMGNLPAQDAVTIARCLASALELTHSQGILHRDLKPSNIIIPDHRGISGVVLLDFSLAGTLQSESQKTQAGQFFGTPNYMSPEQLHRAPQTRATDVWGLGVLLYEMLFAHTPFEREQIAQTVYAIAGETPKLPSSDPWQLNDILLRCLAKQPNERYSSIGELERELHTWQNERINCENEAPPMPAPAVTYHETVSPHPDEPIDTPGQVEGSAPLGPRPINRKKRLTIVLSFATVFLALSIGIATVVLLKGETSSSAGSPAPAAPLPNANPPDGSSSSPATPTTAPKAPFPLWAYSLPFIVAIVIWLSVRKLLGQISSPNTASPRKFQNLSSQERRQELTRNLGFAADEMIAMCQGDAPANFMALSLGLALQDYREENEPQNRAAALDQAVKLLELLQQRVPNTLAPWYVRYNQLLAFGISLAGLILTLMGMLLPR